MQRGGQFLKLMTLAIAVLLTACDTTRNLVGPPNLYSSHNPYPQSQISTNDQTVEAEILYVTDRASDATEGDVLTYGDERSDSMAAGIARVRFGNNLSWEDLTTLASSTGPKAGVPVELISVSEVERFSPTPLPFYITPNGPVLEANEYSLYRQSADQLKKLVRDRLSQSRSKDIIIFVHGFNNSFEEAVFSLNDVWHYSGRIGVPIVYSWPSGSGSLMGYFSDRESGEFTIHHLKEVFRILAEVGEIERIHVIAHSRGTDVTTSALRELVIETRAAGLDPQERLRIDNLILAAPDLDYGVVKQRLIAEQFGPAFGQITIYMNEEDSALGLSQWLMQGVRFGRLTESQQGIREDQIFRNVGNVSFINVKDVSGFVGHSYFREHPGALSDIIEVITTSSRPGSSERPLTHIGSNFWTLDRDYLRSDNQPN